MCICMLNLAQWVGEGKGGRLPDEGCAENQLENCAGPGGSGLYEHGCDEAGGGKRGDDLNGVDAPPYAPLMLLV